MNKKKAGRSKRKMNETRKRKISSLGSKKSRGKKIAGKEYEEDEKRVLTRVKKRKG